MQTVIAILGPTASGKSALAVRLAQRFGGSIVSADSRQIYRGMDLGTGKVTVRERRGIPHHLLDVASPRRRWSVARYERAATWAIRTAEPPVWLVGGSPFYLDAAIYPGRTPNVPPNPKLRRTLAARTPANLYQRLQRLDSDRAASIDARNPVRLVRAIEIATALGSVPTRGEQRSPYRVLKLGIRLPEATLQRRIHRRLGARMRAGMLAEVRRLHRSGLTWNALEAFGLEYRFLALHLQGKLTRTDAIAQLARAINQFAKRQMTWWKRDPTIHWIGNAKQAEPIVRRFLS